MFPNGNGGNKNKLLSRLRDKLVGPQKYKKCAYISGAWDSKQLTTLSKNRTEYFRDYLFRKKRVLHTRLLLDFRPRCGKRISKKDLKVFID